MPHPPERVCACGCGTRFRCKGPAHVYAHPSHRPPRRTHSYTAEEARLRATLLAHPPQGDPCPRCRLPMWPEQRLQTGHVIDRALGGTDMGFRWEHGHCNTSAGATLGNRLRLQRAAVQHPDAAKRDW